MVVLFGRNQGDDDDDGWEINIISYYHKIHETYHIYSYTYLNI